MSYRSQQPSRVAYSRSERYEPNPNLRVVKHEIKPTGESYQVVRPVAEAPSSDQIINKLVSQYGYKTSDKINANDLSVVEAAFPKVAKKLIRSQDGSNLVADSNQDLIGDRYLAEQIRRINEENKKKSILDKWSHLLYEGEDERTYVSSYQPPAYEAAPYQPVRSTTFTINNPNNY